MRSLLGRRRAKFKKWLVELAEFERLRDIETRRVREFFTSSIDSFRPSNDPRSDR